ncbi:hypothetical protein D3C85_1570140 [compost metagenome]
MIRVSAGCGRAYRCFLGTLRVFEGPGYRARRRVDQHLGRWQEIARGLPVLSESLRQDLHLRGQGLLIRHQANLEHILDLVGRLLRPSCQ